MTPVRQNPDARWGVYIGLAIMLGGVILAMGGC